MGYEYYFPDAVDGVATGAMGIAAGIMMIVCFLTMGISLVIYVLNAVGMYRIAKRRGIHHAWLAWVPVGSNWLLGSISDHYQYVAKQKVTKRRKILLILSLVLVGVSLLMIGGITATVLSVSSPAASITIALSVVVMIITYLGMIGLAIAITVISYIACFDLFRSCRPENDVLFLILSIFLGAGIFVFVCSGHDKGMPPKRVPQQPVQVMDTPAAEEAAVEPVEEEIPVVEAVIVEDPE